jgi:hypothetical protein
VITQDDGSQDSVCIDSSQTTVFNHASSARAAAACGAERLIGNKQKKRQQYASIHRTQLNSAEQQQRHSH